jgi:hypothetical protein
VLLISSDCVKDKRNDIAFLFHFEINFYLIAKFYISTVANNCQENWELFFCSSPFFFNFSKG